MLKNPFKSLEKHEWLLWGISFVVIIISNICAKNIEPITLIGTCIGVTAMIFEARGDVWGPTLTVVFSILYAVVSYKFHYYGEVITYLGMTMPIALMSIFAWLAHPFSGNTNEVEIDKLTKKQFVVMIALSIFVTLVFYFILKFFNTPNMFFSTLSITTSFIASYLTLYRNSYYAVAYAANDIVLIILWILATVKDFSYLPMIMCFVIFLINDIYAFFSWKTREKKQRIVK